MELFHNLALGIHAAFSLNNIIYCFIGCLLGTLIGILPGLGPAATIAMLLPITFTLDPAGSLIMLAGIYYGAQYGGSTTAILVNLPGESSSVVTAIDGYQLAKQGKAGLALSTAALGSFFAGSVATLVIATSAPLLTGMALKFKATEYFSLMVLGLLASVALAHGSIIKSLAMTVLGLILGIVGTDAISGTHRLTFGTLSLSDGLSIVAVAMGVYGLGEVMHNLSNASADRDSVMSKTGRLMPNRKEFWQIVPPVLRGTALGSLLGILPGGGALLSSFVAYAVEKKVSKTPERFGHGAIEGVAGPESANNAGAQTSFIPMLTLGIPANPVMALMIGAMIIQGIQPGPSVMREQPTLFWSLIASMWLGNLMLVVLNLPLIGIWIRLLTVRYQFLFPGIIVFCCIGVYTVNNSIYDVYIMAIFGVSGYILKYLGCELAPLLLGMVLGPMLEQYLRRSMLLSHGDPTVFFTQPISATLLAVAFAIVLFSALPAIRKKRDVALQESD